MSDTNTVNDFDAAKAICDQLKGLDKDRQHRILRWVAESLDLVLHTRTALHEGAAEHKVTVEAAHEQGQHTQPLPGRTQDIKTFVESKKPKSDMQFATVVAYYFRFEAGQSQRRETVTSEALQEAARLCARPRFKHPVMTLTNAKNQGYLDSPARGEFSINTVGENLVAMTLPGGERATNGKRKKRRESAPAKRTAKR